MIDKKFEEILSKHEFVVIPTDGVVDMWQDDLGLVRMTVGVGKSSQDEAKVGYIIARRQYFQLRSNPYEEGGMYWKYLVKFSDGSTEGYKEEEIYLDYDKRLEDE